MESPTPLPQVALATPLASQVADLVSIRHDVDFVVAACGRLRTTLSDPPSLEHDALWRSAVIAYRRAFNAGKAHLAPGRTRQKLPISEWLAELGGDSVATHEAALWHANKHIAHRIGDEEQIKVLVFLNDPAEGRGIEHVGAATMRLIVPTELLPRLEVLARDLGGRLQTEIERGLGLVREQAERVGLEELYAQAARNPMRRIAAGSCSSAPAGW